MNATISYWVRRWALGGGIVFALSGCESKGSNESASGTTAPAASAASGVPMPAAQAPTAAGSANAKCPAGRWSYDYSDQALEVMMQNTVGAKVLEEQGSFVCNVPAGEQGTIVCATQDKPVKNVVETDRAGIKMTISVTIDGKASTQFAKLDGRQMSIVSSDTSGLKIDTKVTLGGKEIPFPGDKLIEIFGKSGGTTSYKCEGGRLYLKPHIDGTETPWQELEPVR